MGYSTKCRQSIANAIQNMLIDVIHNLPYGYISLLRAQFTSDLKTVLDVGCGDGNLLKVVLPRFGKFIVRGVDAHLPSIRVAKETGIYEKIHLVDLTNSRGLVINRKYDLVFCSQVLEHLPKEKGNKLLDSFNRISSKKTVVTTPNGFVPFMPVEKGKAYHKYQRHVSGWNQEEFESRGFRVYGQGLKLIYNEGAITRKLPFILQIPLFFLSYLCAPLVYYFPKLGYYLIAIKKQ